MKILKKILLAFVFLLIAAGVAFGMLIGFHVIEMPQLFGSSDSGNTESTYAAREGLSSELDSNTEETANPPITATIEQTDECTVETVSDFDMTSLVKEALPSIVSVIMTGESTSLWYGTYQYSASGTGIIISEDEDNYYIATNAHVISGYITVSVVLANSDPTDESSVSYEVSVKGSDSTADLALLVLSKEALSEEDASYVKVAELADADTAEPGNPAIAIGNALCYGLSVTVGYISAIDREVTSSTGVTMTLIQTDAAINPGNSGGALINTDGQVIGINSSKFSDDSVEGMGFAIPIASALPLLQEFTNLEEFPEDEQGYLGVYITEIDSSLSEEFSLPEGIFIREVMENSSAEAAGLMASDIITGVNGIQVKTTSQLAARITSYRAGTTITLTVMRKNTVSGEYEEIEVPVTLMTKDSMQLSEEE